MRSVTLMLKAIHSQENKEAAREKAASVAAKLREMKLSAAAKKVEESVDETPNESNWFFS
jgi:putative transposase